MSSPESDLRDVVTRAAARLRAFPPERAAARPAPGQWSLKEIVGHLVDSAWTNQQRFVRACLQDELVFEGYPQEDYVALQRHGEAPWDELVDVWEHLNRHLARTVAALPADERTRPRATHALDRIAWELVPASEPVSLDYFVRDYVNHLQYHLHAFDPELAPAPVLQREGGAEGVS